MTQDDHMETITDPAEIRASDEPDERGDFPRCATPAPSSGAGPDLGALHETICDNFTGMAEVRQAADLLVAEVRRLVKYRDWWKASSLANAEDVRRLTAICHDWRDRSETAEAEVRRLTEESERLKRGGTELGRILDRALMMALDASGCHDVIEEDGDGDWEVVWETLAGLRPRAEAAEAEVVTLRAKVAAVEALVNNGQTVGWIERDGDVAWIAADAIRAALAVTTGEGQ